MKCAFVQPEFYGFVLSPLVYSSHVPFIFFFRNSTPMGFWHENTFTFEVFFQYLFKHTFVLPEL